MKQRKQLLDEAKGIFGAENREAVERWVDYWQHSKERNRALLHSFERLTLINFERKRVLDIGCGTGGLGEIIGDRCHLYVGADYNLHVLKFADAALRRKYLQCSGVALPFQDACFDYIFAFDVIEHIQGGEPLQTELLREMKRVLRPFGMIFLTTPNLWHPFEGHSRMYFPQYLPTFLADRYVGLFNPGFLKEHNTFGEIQLLSPRVFKRTLRNSGLTFLHDLPNGLDRLEFLKHAPWAGVFAYLGLGWYPHAEFWGILVKRSAQEFLRRKLRRTWFYEQNQPSANLSDFQPSIDFRRDAYGYQLGDGWYWHENNGTGFRWMRQRSSCYLENRGSARFVRVHGYSPLPANRLEIRVWANAGDGLVVGEHFCKERQEFQVEYLIPFPPRPGLTRVDLAFDQTFRPDKPDDQRELSAMIFELGLTEERMKDEGGRMKEEG
ncbi:MAG: class I SAM-dependent methyltransferase [Acidobacteria bacterium]|nr:MAG: class I SAM-dependent methyltransferase [Acidobacteriota bacterium]